MGTTADLYTTYKNPTGASRFYGYIGSHGTTLAANGQFSVFGHPAAQLGLRSNRLKQYSLENDLLAVPARIEILKTPKQIFQDANPAAILGNPTVTATVVVGSATTGALPAGIYKVGYTFVNTWGETLVGGGSATFNVGAGNAPVVTLPSLPTGASSMNVYLTNTNASSGPYALYASGITTTSDTLGSASFTNGTKTFANSSPPPTVNTTTGPAALVQSLSGGTLSVADASWGREY